MFLAYFVSQASIQVIKDTKLSSAAIGSLSMFVRERTYTSGQYILQEGKTSEAALYLVHHGKVKLTSEKDDFSSQTIESFGHFGEELMTVDQVAGSNGPKDPTIVSAPYSAKAVEESRVGVLSLENCRKVFDTVSIGQGSANIHDSLLARSKPVSLQDLKKHTILGAGKSRSCEHISITCFQ